MITADEQMGNAVLEAITHFSVEEFGPRFTAGYALGSLARGGFSALVSDVDFAMILTAPLMQGDAQRIEMLREKVSTSELPLANRLSIFWGSPASLRNEEPGGRFPPFDKLDLLEHGRLLAGVDNRDGIPAPTKRKLETSGIEFALNSLGTPARIEEYRRHNVS